MPARARRLPLLLLWAVVAALGCQAAPAAAQAAAAETARAEIAAPLQAAQDLIRAGKPKDALLQLRQADAVPQPSPYERFLLDQTRGTAALAAGDDATLTRAFTAVLASGRLAPAASGPVLEALAGAAFRARDYPKTLAWTTRYLQEVGPGEAMRNLAVRAHFQSGDHAGVLRALQPALDASTLPADDTTVRMLAVSCAKLGNDPCYDQALEKLLVLQPKKEQWADRLSRLQNDAGFADRLLLDLYRLRRATDTLEDAEQVEEMAQLALKAALPAEAQRVVEAGFATGKLGHGPDAARHQRLRETVRRQAADDEQARKGEVAGRGGEALVSTGQLFVTTGRLDKGIEMLEYGIAMGGLKRPDEAALHLGQAYLLAGKPSKALELFQSVRGGDGAADLARLWAIHAGRR